MVGSNLSKVCGHTMIGVGKKKTNRMSGKTLNNIKIKDVWEYPDIVREKAEEIDLNGGQLVIKEFPTGQATTNTILAHLRTLEANEGFVPDIIFIDYADIMKPLANFSEKRHSLTSIYEGIRGIAVELGIPIWTASQTNRAGMNKDKFGLVLS